MATRPKFARLAHYSCKCVKASLIFSKMAFGKCQRVWRVRAKQVGKCRRVWRVRANQVGECRRVWQVLAKPFDECWHKKDRSFYAQITYFICIKRSSLHSLNTPNSPNLPNSPNSCKTCLSGEFSQNGLANVRESGESKQTRLVNVDEFSKSDPFSKRVILASTRICQKWRISGEYSNSINSLSSGHCLL